MNYDKDIFCFGAACCNTNNQYGEVIANWFGIPHVAEDTESSDDAKDIEKELIGEGETQHRIFSARRLAFHVSSSSPVPSFPTFQERDIQMLARFNRLKEIIFLVGQLRDVPTSLLERADKKPRGQLPLCGNMLTLSYFDAE